MPFSCHRYRLGFWCRESPAADWGQPNHVYAGGVALACSDAEVTCFDDFTSKCRYVFAAVDQTLILVKVSPAVACPSIHRQTVHRAVKVRVPSVVKVWQRLSSSRSGWDGGVFQELFSSGMLLQD